MVRVALCCLAGGFGGWCNKGSYEFLALWADLEGSEQVGPRVRSEGC
jgi:hypothetical protein